MSAKGINIVDAIAKAERQTTENGAVGFSTVGDALVDLNFKSGSFRGKGANSILPVFSAAFDAHPEDTLKWAFYLRDVRGGMGEREAFKIILAYLADAHTTAMRPLVKLIPEYGRWDDLFALIGTPLENELKKVIKTEWDKDMLLAKDGKANGAFVSAKWMPSENASSAKTKELGRFVRTTLGISPKQYRQGLSLMRKLGDVVERKMSSKEWGSISYKGTPSRAMSIYRTAFGRNDTERFTKYLKDLKEGKTTIHAAGLNPCEVLAKAVRDSDSKDLATDEAQWKALPAYAEDVPSCLVVADVSGSMSCNVPNSSIELVDVSASLALFCAQYCKGIFKNHLVSFSEEPEMRYVSPTLPLATRSQEVRKNGGYNTNIEAVFDLILNAAANAKATQKDLPGTVLVISDMEFDDAILGSLGEMPSLQNQEALFDVISEKYAAAGYHLPRLVFWNVGSRTQTIPVQESKYGLAYISGYNQSVLKMVLSGKLDPLSVLLDTLHSERYSAIKIRK